MTLKCDSCNSEIEINVTYCVNHNPSRSYGEGSYTLKLEAQCECESESPMATELSSIKFHGNPPEGWQ